jgi:predicted  nucleic acid-binding Zn-ribbon protein
MEPGSETPPGPEAVQRDMLGRGEEWWRARAKEWNEKLMIAQRNYENAYNEWKTKEQELEESRFKPDSAKRKLQSEIKSLQEKAKDREKEMNEAKNMVENVLPNEARNYRANPEWLRIEENK